MPAQSVWLMFSWAWGSFRAFGRDPDSNPGNTLHITCRCHGPEQVLAAPSGWGCGQLSFPARGSHTV